LRAPLAITVIGGLTVATVLTLIVIPVVYTLIDRKAFAVAAAVEPAGGVPEGAAETAGVPAGGAQAPAYAVGEIPLHREIRPAREVTE
jgi:hypothetical protein